jgi:hypothetical protein
MRRALARRSSWADFLHTCLPLSKEHNTSYGPPAGQIQLLPFHNWYYVQLARNQPLNFLLSHPLPQAYISQTISTTPAKHLGIPYGLFHTRVRSIVN